jgi:hypothetical protein
MARRSGWFQADKNLALPGVWQSIARVCADWWRTLERPAVSVPSTGLSERDCFLSLMKRAASGGAPRVRLAKSCVRSMLTILRNYGTELGLPGGLDRPTPSVACQIIGISDFGGILAPLIARKSDRYSSTYGY